MSIKHLNWAFQQDVASGPKLTLIALCDSLNEDGEWRIKHETLAKKTSQHRSTIIRHIADLVKLGLVESTGSRKKDGRQGYNKYRVVMRDPGKKPESHPVEPESHSATLPESHSATAITTQINSPNIPPKDIDHFDRFWKIYPRKAGKGDARKAWEAAIKTTPAETIVSAVESQLPWMESQYGGPRDDFRPHPATWLNSGRWGDNHDPPLTNAEKVDRALQEKWERAERQRNASQRETDPGLCDQSTSHPLPLPVGQGEEPD